jgi:hypothetical protein
VNSIGRKKVSASGVLADGWHTTCYIANCAFEVEVGVVRAGKVIDQKTYPLHSGSETKRKRTKVQPMQGKKKRGQCM